MPAARFASSAAAPWLALAAANEDDFEALLSLRMAAMRESLQRLGGANRFYQRHGFELQHETEWDLHYLRPALGDRDA